MTFEAADFEGKRIDKDEILAIVSALEANPEPIHQLFSLLFHDNERITFQVSWILLNACKKKSLKPYFRENLSDVFSIIRRTSSTSLLRAGQRYFIEVGIPNELEDDLIDFSFHLLDNKYNEVAILSNAFHIIESLLKKYPDYLQPLYEATTIIKDRQPTSFQSKYKKFVTKYESEIRFID